MPSDRTIQKFIIKNDLMRQNVEPVTNARHKAVNDIFNAISFAVMNQTIVPLCEPQLIIERGKLRTSQFCPNIGTLILVCQRIYWRTGNVSQRHMTVLVMERHHKSNDTLMIDEFRVYRNEFGSIVRHTAIFSDLWSHSLICDVIGQVLIIRAQNQENTFF